MTHQDPWTRPAALDRLLPGPGLIVSRGFLWVALFLVASTAIWTAVARLDVVIEARGRLTVRGEPIRIALPEGGLVVEAPVRVGGRVAAGDVLLRLDTLEIEAELARVEADIAVIAAEAERHREAARAALAVLAEPGGEIGALERLREDARKDLDRAAALQAEGLLSLLDVSRARERVSEIDARLARARGELDARSRDASERQRLAHESDRRIATLAARRDHLGERRRRATVRAPEAGTIAHLAFRHAGSVLAPAETVVVLLPDGLPLLAEIEIPNASMRRLEPGLAVRIELDAYPRQEHGHLEGNLVEVEPDAGESGAYRAWVSLERAALPDSGLLGRVRPGLRLRASMVLESRRVSDFLLDPLRRLGGASSVSG